MSLWYQPPGGAAIQVNPTDIVILDQGGVTRSVTLDVLFSSLTGIQPAANADEQAQLFAKGVQGIIRTDLLDVVFTTTLPPVTSSTTPQPTTTTTSTTPQPTTTSTTTTSTTTTSTTTGAPGTPPSATIVFSNFS